MKELEIEYNSTLGPHYSAAVIHCGMVYVSGQLAMDPETGKIVSGGIREHTWQALNNLKAVLARAKTDPSHVVRCRVYTSDLSNWEEINAVYREFFGKTKPARTIVPTRELHFGSLVEIEATAYLDAEVME